MTTASFYENKEEKVEGLQLFAETRSTLIGQNSFAEKGGSKRSTQRKQKGSKLFDKDLIFICIELRSNNQAMRKKNNPTEDGKNESESSNYA